MQINNPFIQILNVRVMLLNRVIHFDVSFEELLQVNAPLWGNVIADLF